MYAIADGLVAEPKPAESTRKTIRLSGLHATALSSPNTPARRRPPMNTRRCPHRSPALPNAGPITPNERSGPVIVHDITETDVPRSAAIVGRDTTSNVIERPTVNTLAKSTSRVNLRWVIPPQGELAMLTETPDRWWRRAAPSRHWPPLGPRRRLASTCSACGPSRRQPRTLPLSTALLRS